MVNVIMSIDGEPQPHLQSQAVRFVLKNWTQFMGLDCYTFTISLKPLQQIAYKVNYLDLNWQYVK